MFDPGCLIKVDKACTYGSAKWSALIWLIVILAVIVVGPFLFDWTRQKWKVARLKRARDAAAVDANRADERAEINEELERWRRPLRVRLLGAVMGEDERMSTTKSVALVWLLVVAYVLLALVLIWPPDEGGSWDKALSNLGGAYLALLGGPTATVVLSKTIVSSRIRRGTIQKPQSDGIPRLGDLVADDSGDTDLFDLQYLVFNTIAVVFVLTGFSKATLDGFPDVPDVLWLLTGGPAAVFVSNKALGTNAPVIFSVDPARVRPGEQFTVFGQNFTVGATTGAAMDAADAETVRVQVNGAKAEVVADSVTAVSVRAVVPLDLPASDTAVVAVITDAGVLAARADRLVIVRDPVLNPPSASLSVAPGATFTLTGAWTPGPYGPTVLVNNVAATTTNATSNAVVVTVPQGTPRGAPVQVVVLDAVGRSQPVTLAVS